MSRSLPGQDPEGLFAAAHRCLSSDQLPQALKAFHEAEAAGAAPDECAGGRWMAYMLCGDFQAAWGESDAIRARGAPDPHRFWLGQELTGKRVILRSLHGFGDAVQMFRFLPRLRSRCADVLVEVPPRMVSLAPCFEGMGQVLTWGEDAPRVGPEWDVQIEVMELPYVLRIGPDELQPGSGYLHLPQIEQIRVREALGPRQKPRIGLVWGSGEWNASRSVPLRLFEELMGHPDAEFWSLQGGAEQARWTGPLDGARAGQGLLALAATVAEMDLVLTVDTLAAHLAGALGVPCWVLLQRRADWRWMSRREDTPWYPSLRLLRQGDDASWESLLRDVKQRLDRWLSEKAEGASRCRT